MPYHDKSSPDKNITRQTRTQETETQIEQITELTPPVGGGGDNPITLVNQIAQQDQNWTYELTGEPYVGLYHQHQDGTYMIGAGQLGVVHEINLNEVIIQPTESLDLNIPDIPESDMSSTAPNQPESDPVADYETIQEVREIVSDLFYKFWFESNTLTDEQVLSLQTTIRDGIKQTGRTEDEPLVFYKKDRNTLENRQDLQGESFELICNDIFNNNIPNIIIPTLFSFPLPTTEPYNSGVELATNTTQEIKRYIIKYDNNGLIYNVITAEELLTIQEVPEMDPVIIDDSFINILNLSQLTTVKTGTKINPTKAREVLDTNIFELLPTQTTRQDQINDFFNEFNDLIGQPPPYEDIDNDGVGENIPEELFNQDEQNRVSYENKSTAYITRLNSQANTNNQDKTLESMRNQLNTYLADVDNVIQVISDERPEYENKSSGFLKIRKPNQAIILRNPNQELEFQKDNSYLTNGFTITMWVRFVGKTGRGTLFNFGNPTSTEEPYGFRLETITRLDNQDKYRRIIRLVVRNHINGKLYDSSFGAETRNRYNTIQNNALAFNDSTDARFYDYVQVPTTDLNEWFFVCATYDPTIDEEGSFEEPYFTFFRRNKQFWLNHIEAEFSAAGLEDNFVANSGFGARCKVEIISRSDLLRARGFKVDSLEYNV